MIHIMKIQKYSLEIEVKMRAFYESLSEKDRRRYAAVETEKLGYGGAGTGSVTLHFGFSLLQVINRCE